MVRDRFGLANLGRGINRRASELSEDAAPRSADGSSEGPMKPFSFSQEDFDRTEAPKDDMRKYWRQYETTPIIRKPISSFASRVMQPGYYIEAGGLEQSEVKEIERWLEDAAIIEGVRGEDFRLLAKKAIVQREVRGTALVEKAPAKEDEDKIAGLKLINPETVEVVTRPGQSILLDPDDHERWDDVPTTAAGEAAAYLQDVSETGALFGTPIRETSDDGKIGFRHDQVIKLTRDADVGEVFGTSRLEAVSDRIDGIKQKLSDNDEAISSKAYPLWLFLFGTEENPWESDRINQFMNAHEMENFFPGMKQGVRGDVSVETISGEVADIAQYLNFDVNWIMSVMPMPMFALGSFGDMATAGQAGAIAQQQDITRQIAEARRELEDEFTKVVREVAKQKGYPEEAVEDMQLHIGKPGQPDIEQPRNEQVIRYINETAGGGQQQQQQQQQGQDPDGNPFLDFQSGSADEQPGEEAGAQVWHNGDSIAELQISTGESEQTEVSDEVFEALTQARDNTLERIEQEFGDSPSFAAANFENVANSVMNETIHHRSLRRSVKDPVERAVEGVLSEFGNQRRGFGTNQNVTFFSQNIENSTRDAMDEMLRLMRIQVRRGVMDDESWDNIRERVEAEYNDAKLRQRSELIAQMELKKVVERTKLEEFEKDSDIVGIRVVNESASTPLTQSLHGAEAFFDDGDIGEQLQQKTRREFLQKGFDPLPSSPPFHFQDTTTLEPIYADDT